MKSPSNNFRIYLSNVTGRVAAEDAVPNAVKSAPPMLPMKRNGKLRVAMAKLDKFIVHPSYNLN